MKETAKEKSAKKPRPERATLASLNHKVDLMDSRLRTLKAWETMQDAMEESRSAPAEEWTPKVGELAVYDGMCGKVEAHDVNVGEWWHIFGRWVPTRKLSEPTEAEIAPRKAKEEQRAKEAQWAKVSELMEWDACECEPGQKAELLRIAEAGGVRKLDDEPAPNLRWERWTTGTDQILIETVSPAEYSKKASPLNWLPFPEFKRRLQGTIAKRAEDELAKELAKPIGFGTRIDFHGRKGIYIQHDCHRRECPHRLVIQWGANPYETWQERSEFTIID